MAVVLPLNPGEGFTRKTVANGVPKLSVAEFPQGTGTPHDRGNEHTGWGGQSGAVSRVGKLGSTWSAPVSASMCRTRSLGAISTVRAPGLLAVR